MQNTEYRRTLRFYALYRTENPTTLDVLRYNAWLWVYWWIVTVCTYLLLDRWVSPTVAVACSAVLAGAALRDLRYCHSVARRWPRMRELLDWEKVEQELEKDRVDGR
jgi:hypothetical protein